MSTRWKCYIRSRLKGDFTARERDPPRLTLRTDKDFEPADKATLHANVYPSWTTGISFRDGVRISMKSWNRGGWWPRDGARNRGSLMMEVRLQDNWRSETPIRRRRQRELMGLANEPESSRICTIDLWLSRQPDRRGKKFQHPETQMRGRIIFWR